MVKVFGYARTHHAYLFMNRRANRLKVLVHDGFGLWLCAIFARIGDGGSRPAAKKRPVGLHTEAGIIAVDLAPPSSAFGLGVWMGV